MIQTTAGTVINPFDFHAEDITIEELAHSLACQNRFFGHARFPISIAQHAVSVSLLVAGTADEMQGLHHDDSEAILGDMNKWLKEARGFEEYRLLEHEIQTLLYLKFGCPTVLATTVQQADRLAVRCEMTFAFGRKYQALHPDYCPPTNMELDLFIHRTNFVEGISWKHAKWLYLERHAALNGTT